MAVGAWVRTRRVNVLKREKPRLCADSSTARMSGSNPEDEGSNPLRRANILRRSIMRIRYICKYCNEINEITGFWKWFWTPHFGNKKWMKCKHCDSKKHFMARYNQKWSMIDWPKEK